MSDARRGVLIRLPLELKVAVLAEADQQGLGMNDVLVGAIASRYGMQYVPSLRRSRRPDPMKSAIVLRMDDALKLEVQFDALRQRSNMTDTLVRLLAEAFSVDIDFTPPRRQTPFGGGRGRGKRS
jgi:hypothetical protein